MSMYTEAEKINEKMIKDNWTQNQLEALLRFGQVAKFRCRSNIAYKNFVEAVCKNIAKIEEETIVSSNEEYKKMKVIKL